MGLAGVIGQAPGVLQLRWDEFIWQMLSFVQGKKGKKAHYLGKPGEAASTSLLPGALGLQGNPSGRGEKSPASWEAKSRHTAGS